MGTIRNVVFDIGNVVVPWQPHDIVREALGEDRVSEPGFRSPLAGNPLWLAVNRGEYSLAEAKRLYVEDHGLTAEEVDSLYAALFDSMILLDGTTDLIRDLAQAGYRLFAITDNVHEVVAHLKERHDFWDHFERTAVSAELGVLKPDPQMYLHIVEGASLAAHECVFFDDVEKNVAGAEAVGMVGRLFTTAEKARKDLAELGVAL